MIASKASSRAIDSGACALRRARNIGKLTSIICGKPAMASPRAPVTPNLLATIWPWDGGAFGVRCMGFGVWRSDDAEAVSDKVAFGADSDESSKEAISA